MGEYMNKNINKLLFCFVIFSFLGYRVFAEDPSITVTEDTASTYVPTQIINGDFEVCPTGGNGVNNGTDEGWNTTETATYENRYFEWLDHVFYQNNLLELHGGNLTHWIEMNCTNDAVLSQDLTTYGGDVIRWTLEHALRSTTDGVYEEMAVEIGAPVMNGNSIVYPAGINDDVNSNIQESTKAVYLFNGVTGNNGYGNTDELTKLRLNAGDEEDLKYWHTCKGVYIVPEGQSVTRFAFISKTEETGYGNFLDNLSFSTLIGNLSAVQNSDGSVTIKGYWGETDTSKKLKLKIGNEILSVDMSSVCGKNFVAEVPLEIVKGNTYVKVYHEDYVSASKIVFVGVPVISYENLDYIYLDAEKWQNIEIPYMIPNQDTAYSWELTFSDLTKISGRCASLVGTYNGSRSGYLYSNEAESKGGTADKPKFLVCVGDGDRYPYYEIGGKSEINTIKVSYTHNGSTNTGTYAISDTLGDIGTNITGEWTGNYAINDMFSLVACAKYNYGTDPVMSYEFCSLKFYNVKIYEKDSNGDDVLKVDLVPVVGNTEGSKEVFVKNKVDGKFYQLAGYAKEKPDTITVTLDNQSATVAGTKSISAVKGGSLASTIPSLPSKTDYFFKGYFTQQDGIGTRVYNSKGELINGVKFDADTTLYAFWSTEEDSFSLGELTFRDGIGYLDNVAGDNPNKFKGITVSFTEEIKGNEKIVPPTVSGFENASFSTDASITINSTKPDGATLNEIIAYLKQIQFVNCSTINQKIMVMLEPETIDNLTLYCEDTGHYYQHVQYTVPDGSTIYWNEAYDDAKSKTYAGRQGYLVTITSLEEELFLYRASNKQVSWIGGTTLKHGSKTSDGLYYESFSLTDNNDASLYEDHWYWACGPEIGEEFFDSISKGDAEIYARNAAKGYYFDWGNPSNESYQEPNNINESCATLLSVGKGYSTATILGSVVKDGPNKSYWGTGCGWNDALYDSVLGQFWTPTGYFIEYGNLSYGDTASPESTKGTSLRVSTLISKGGTRQYSVDARTVTGCTVSGTGTYSEGETATVTVSSTDGRDYFIKDTSGEILSSTNTYTFTVTRNFTVVPAAMIVKNMTKAKSYYSLEDAAAETSEGDNVVLFDNVVMAEDISNANFNLDGNSYTVSSENRKITFVKNASLKNVIFDGITMESSAGISVSGKVIMPELILTGGVITIQEGFTTDSSICIKTAPAGVVTNGFKTVCGNPLLGTIIYFRNSDKKYGFRKTKDGELKVFTVE